MSKILTLLITVCSTMILQAAKVEKDVTIKVDGENRTYKLYVPNNIEDNCPFVLSLHGAGGGSNDKSPFGTDVADWAGCIVAYPQGKPTPFPIGFGGSANGWTATGEDNFDVKFLKAVIEDVASRYKIDRKRLYCCGFSNGGMMTYAMSNVCSDIFAAFASISGYPINEFHLRHTGWRPVPFLHIHGKADNFVLYEKMPAIVDEMVARMGANPVPKKTIVNGKYTKSIYEAAEGSFPYVYYEMDGMGHSPYTGNTDEGNSSKTMWNFFKQYTLDTPCDTTLKWCPRIEEEGYTPKNHGWTMNSQKTLLKFGGTQYNTTNKNVYRSLQFDNGFYKLHFKSEGSDTIQIAVNIQKLTGKKNLILSDTISANGEANLYFKVEDGWGEYKLTITRPSSTDVITITDIVINSVTEEELLEASIQKPSHRQSVSNDLFTLTGMRVKNPKAGNIYIKNNKKIFFD